MKNLYRNVDFSLGRLGKLYDDVDSFTTEKYLSLSSAFEDMVSQWENIVCRIFKWDSYYVNPSIYNGFHNKTNPLKESLGELTTGLMFHLIKTA